MQNNTAEFYAERNASERVKQLAAEVPAENISDRFREAAAIALQFAVERLELASAPELRWYAASYMPGAMGFYDCPNDEIWLRSTIADWQLVRSVLHEARHAWQVATLPDDDPKLASTPAGAEWREHDAENWAENAQRNLAREYQ